MGSFKPRATGPSRGLSASPSSVVLLTDFLGVGSATKFTPATLIIATPLAVTAAPYFVENVAHLIGAVWTYNIHDGARREKN